MSGNMWDRTPDQWLRDVLREADVESGKLEDAEDKEREQAATGLVLRAFEMGCYAQDMRHVSALCTAARGMVRGSLGPAFRDTAFRAAGVPSGDAKDATKIQHDVVMSGTLDRLAQHLVDLDHPGAGKLVAQAARLLAASPRNPFGERTGGAS